MYNKDKIFQMTGLSESAFYKKYPTKAHFEKEHGADIFDKGGFMQDDATKSNQKAFNKSEQMYNDSLALFNSANLDSQWMAKVDKNKVSRKDFNAQMQTQDRDALQDAYDRLLRTNNQAPEISSDTLNVLRSNSPKATKETILMNKYKKPTNPPLNPNNFPTKKERDAMDLRQMNLNQQFAEGGLMEGAQGLSKLMTPLGTLAGGVIGAGIGAIGASAASVGTAGAALPTLIPAILGGAGLGAGLGGAAGKLGELGVNGLAKGVNSISKSVDNIQQKQFAAGGPLTPGISGGLGIPFMKLFGRGGAMENNTELQKLMQNLKDTNEGKLTEINAGGTHEENPNNGVPIMQGKLAEENETIFDSDEGKFIFSDRNGYADKSKKIEKKYSKRTGDKLANESKKRELSTLMLQQEAEKALASNNSQNEEMFDTGGLLNNLNTTGLGTLNTPGAFDIKIPNYDTEAGKFIAKVKSEYGYNPPDINPEVRPNKAQFLDTYINKTPGGLPMATTLNNSHVPREVRPNMDRMKTLPATRIDMPKVKQPNIFTGEKVGSTTNFNLKDLDLSILEYLPQTAGSLFNIAKGIGSNKQINYKGITPKLNNSNYNLTSSLTNLNSDSAGVNADIRNNSNLTLAQKISALGSVSANTQKARASMINEGNYNNMMGNTNLINTAKQYNAGVFDRNIDANEMYQDKRAEAVKTGLDNLGTGSSTYIKDKRAEKYEGLNNELLGTLMRELYPEATKRAKYKFNR